MENMFEKAGAENVISRINKLTTETKPQWGKMSVDQMLAHCNVQYDMTYSDLYKKPTTFSKFMLKLFVKKAVVGPKPYPKNGRTAPQFIIKDQRNFEEEKKQLLDNIKKTQELGLTHFEGKESHSFGSLTSGEWNTMFSKHIDHHLTQFGV